MLPTTYPSRNRARLATVGWLGSLVLAVALTVVTGCTSDDPNFVGVGLVDAEIDTVLKAVNLDRIDRFGVLDVVEISRPLDEYDVVYLGRDSTGNRSSIMANYDFAALDHPDSAEIAGLLRRDNIRSVRIALYMLTYYFPNHGNPVGDDDPDSIPRFWPGSRKFYDVHELDAPFDTLTYPADEPPYNGGLVNRPQAEPAPADGPIFIDLDVDIVASWIESRREVGIIMREGASSETGLLGFASKEMVFGGSTLPPEDADVTVGVTLLVGLEETPDDWDTGREYWVLAPAADISTWHLLNDPPIDVDDGIMFRTHLRSYPMVYFDLANLPTGVRVNRALLTLTTDVPRTYGQRNTIAVSEVDPDFVPPGVTEVPLNSIASEIFFITGRSGLDTEDPDSDIIEFDVTSSIQRYVNNAYEGLRGFLLTAGEEFIPAPYNERPDPHFWFSQRVFYGSAAADSAVRPRLEITYTRDNAIGKGLE